MSRSKSAYAAAGVDIDEKTDALKAVKQMIKLTSTKGTLGEIGAFGGFFKSPAGNKVLVASADGVGTKIKVAAAAGRHHTVGQDIVNHCVNDILVHGAEPLFFLDYFGTAHFEPWIFKAVVAGLCKACRENGCTLLGGETAEMPGIYPEGEYDLVGTIVGCVDRKRIITGKTIRKGDVIIGLASSGLHTNGFSLARKVIFEKARLDIDDEIPGTGRAVADVLLAIHLSYLNPVKKLLQKVAVHGMAHITGGGFVDNVRRVLPKKLDAVIDRSLWRVPPLFTFIQERGRVDRDEMYRVFNMGIGMTIIVREEDLATALRLLKSGKTEPCVIGRVEKGTGTVRLIS